ncbi:MAG TPA: MFS transporter [Nocardioidaceae bacterium]|nr:MFS transporter [Nocardioidaceae bacterium]
MIDPPDARQASRGLLVVAATAVGFAAADTYVVVLALPDMMSSVGLGIDELQRAAPIVSGFLLGYIAMLPLIGRIADVRGRIPVLVGSLLVFSIGSLVTAASYDLATMVIGRFLQGVGGGGLVPATFALVADLWVADRRGVPLGVVGAVQELGSVLGPLYGAVVLASSAWPTIFWLNLVVGLALAAALMLLPTPASTPPGQVRRAPDVLSLALAAAALTALTLVMTAPERLTRGVTTGLAFIPYLADSRWTTPMAAACYVLAALFTARQLWAARPLVDLRGLRAITTAADLPGGGLLALALAGIVLAFATADPEVEVFSPWGMWFLAASAAAAGLFVWRQRTAREPLVPRRSLHATPAWGSVVVSFFIGASLIAALVDIPIFARITTYPDSQLGAAFVLVRLLAALPVGALAGGYLIRHMPVGALSALGMAVAAGAFLWMATWGETSLDSPLATVPLVLCGLGFGLAIAPVNAALLRATAPQVHGLASAFLVVARMVGMLVGISALTTIGLRRFYAVSADLPSVEEACTGTKICDAYVAGFTEAGVAQVQTIFWGAAACALAAAVLSLLLLRQTESLAGQPSSPTSPRKAATPSTDIG